jgi:hypothetical protein
MLKWKGDNKNKYPPDNWVMVYFLCAFLPLLRADFSFFQGFYCFAWHDINTSAFFLSQLKPPFFHFIPTAIISLSFHISLVRILHPNFLASTVLCLFVAVTWTRLYCHLPTQKNHWKRKLHASSNLPTFAFSYSSSPFLSTDTSTLTLSCILTGHFLRHSSLRFLYIFSVWV